MSPPLNEVFEVDCLLRDNLASLVSIGKQCHELHPERYAWFGLEQLDVVDPHMLAILVTHSHAATRSPLIGNQFITEVKAGILKRLSPLEDMVSSLQLALTWMCSQVHMLKEAKDVLEIIQKKPFRPFPAFPLDIARSIFTLAAKQSVRTARELSLVSKEVQIWADAERFKLIDIEQDKETRLIRLAQDPLSARMQRALCETHTLAFSPPYQAGEWMSTCFPPFLAACVNLKRLYLWHICEPIPISPSHIPSKLKDLCCQSGAFIELATIPTSKNQDNFQDTGVPESNNSSPFPMLDNSEPDADIYLRLDAFNIQHVAFQTITHLDISDTYKWDGQPLSWDGLKDLSSLSHFRLNAGEGGLAAGAHGLAENLPAQIQLCIFILNANCMSGGDQILAPLVMGKIHEKILVGTYYRFEVSVQWHNWVLKMRPLSYPNRESLANFLGDAFNVKRLDKYRDAEELEMRSQYGSKSVWDGGMELLQLRNKNFTRKC